MMGFKRWVALNSSFSYAIYKVGDLEDFIEPLLFIPSLSVKEQQELLPHEVVIRHEQDPFKSDALSRDRQLM